MVFYNAVKPDFSDFLWGPERWNWKIKYEVTRVSSLRNYALFLSLFHKKVHQSISLKITSGFRPLSRDSLTNRFEKQPQFLYGYWQWLCIKMYKVFRAKLYVFESTEKAAHLCTYEEQI